MIVFPTASNDKLCYHCGGKLKDYKIITISLPSIKNHITFCCLCWTEFIKDYAEFTKSLFVKGN